VTMTLLRKKNYSKSNVYQMVDGSLTATA
jgi:hypothetical protein